MSSIKVHLNTTATPPVRCEPPEKVKDRGKRRLAWEPASGETFTFVSLTFNDNPGCFSTPTVTARKVTADDDNTGPWSVGTFTYDVVVELNGKEYSTSATKKKSSAPRSAKKSGALGGASSPMIKNN